MTTHNDHPSYVKHVLGIVYVFLPIWEWEWGAGGCVAKDYHTTNLLMQCLGVGCSKIEVSKLFFLILRPLTMTIQAT